MAIRISGLNSGLDTDSIVQELVSAYSTQKDDMVKKQTKLSWTQDAWKDMNTKIYSFYSKSLSDFKFMSNFSGMKKTTLSDETKASVTAGTGVVNGTQTLKVNRLATAAYLTGKKLESEDEAYKSSTKLSQLGITDSSIKVKIGNEEKTIEVSGDMTIGDFTKALGEQGLKASFDETQQRFFINSGQSGKEHDFEFVVDSEKSFAMLDKLGLATAQDAEKYVSGEIDKKAYAAKQDASNAIIELNGATFEGSSNTFNINGLTITAKGVSESTMSLVTETDVDGIYDKIKGFIKEYNELIKSMDEAYNAESSKGYEPLTDDEKDSMSDAEVEKWEKKIKDSLLRRDSTLNSVASAMKTTMSKSYTINGKIYSLSSFGINTQGYFVAADNEKSVYHIDGNADDDATKSNADKLKAAIASDPDTVASFFNQLASDMYGELDKRMKTTTLSSAYKVYNDKQLQSEYDDYTEQIKKWEEKVSSMEEYYYDKFSAMETALSKLNSQQSQLSGLLGM